MNAQILIFLCCEILCDLSPPGGRPMQQIYTDPVNLPLKPTIFSNIVNHAALFFLIPPLPQSTLSYAEAKSTPGL